QMKKARISAQDELTKYLDEPTCSPKDIESGVLSWWKDRQAIYPHLSKMAMDYLSV
ncbi:unnamed protein product, partial [Allacma fusca]